MPVRKRDGSIGFRPANNETAKWQRSAERQLKALWGDRPILNEPVAVDLRFLIPKRKTVIRDYPTSRMDGDGDKLDRGVWDALTDIVLFDDSLVVNWTGSKRYVDLEEDAGVFVTVSTMEADDGPPQPVQEEGCSYPHCCGAQCGAGACGQEGDSGGAAREEAE